MPQGPWLYPKDEVSDATDRMVAAELTREQLVNQLHQELPYATAVETETWEDRATDRPSSGSRSSSSGTARKRS